MELYGENYIAIMKNIRPEAQIRAGRKEIVIRCPFCGDSKNINHAHLYISIPSDSNTLSFYDCKKCDAHGVVDDEFLRKIGCGDTRVLISVINHNNEVITLPKYRYLTLDIANLELPNNTDLQKINYVNSRIGSNFNGEDLRRLKIFTNLIDVVMYNNLRLTREEYICKQLSDNFIGFVSYDNKFAVLRKTIEVNLPKSIDRRYINYYLIESYNNKKQFYIIPSSINLYDPNPVRIHVAEGVFDILSIYYNLNRCENTKNIYIAARGKSYFQAVQLILLEFGIINYEIHLYPDMDVNGKEIYNLAISKLLKIPNLILYIHRNAYPGEKDFGVPCNRILDEVNSILL